MADPILYVAGNNEHSQLGLGNTVTINTLTQINSLKNASKIVINNGSSFVLNEDGELFSCGNNDNGQLGIGGDTSQISFFNHIDSYLWDDIAISKDRAIGINKENKLLYFSGKAFNPDYNNAYWFSRYYDNNNTWKKVSSSTTHTLAIDTNGYLWGFGKNDKGQLGLGDNIDRLESFVQIGTDKWLTIAAGPNFSAGLKEDGLLYTVGYNEFGQLAIGTYIDTNIFNPVIFADNTEIINTFKMISINENKILAIRSDDILFVSGQNGLESENPKLDIESSLISSENVPWSSICWSPKLEIFCGVNQSGVSIGTSVDGKNWTIQPLNIYGQWESICWSPKLEMFCAVASSGSVRIITSVDGIIWTYASSTTPLISLVSICWSDELGIFCALARGANTNSIITSYDGYDWVQQLTPNTVSGNSICWSSERHMFCVVGSSRTGTYNVMVSDDGIFWNNIETGNDIICLSVCWSSKLEKFCAVGERGSIMTSNNGHTWNEQSFNNVGTLMTVYYSDFLSIYCTSGYNGETNNSTVLISYDGTSWFNIYNNFNVQLRAIVYSEELNIFVSIGYNEPNIDNCITIKYIDGPVYGFFGAIGLGSEIININSLNKIESNEKVVNIAASIKGSYYISENKNLYFTGEDDYNTTKYNVFTKITNNNNWINIYTNNNSVFSINKVDEYVPPVKPDPDPTTPTEPPLIDEPYVMESDHENYIPIYIHDNTQDFLRRGVIINPITAEYLENLDFEKTLIFEVILDKKAVNMIDNNCLLSCRGQIFKIASFDKQATSENTFLVNVQAQHVSYDLAEEVYIKSTIKPPYWVLNETVREISGSIGYGFEGKVIGINSDNEPNISVFNGGNSYVAGEVITVRGDQSNLEWVMTVTQTDQGRIVGIRKATIEEINQRLPEYPWTTGLYNQQWTDDEGVSLQVRVTSVPKNITQGNGKFDNNKLEKKTIKYFVYNQGDKYKLNDEVIVGDGVSLDPINYRRRLAKATVSKIKNKWILNKDGTLSPKPNTISSGENGGDPIYDDDGNEIIYAGPIDTLSNFYTGVSIPEIVEKPEYPNQNELIDDKSSNFFWSGTLTEIVKEILYQTNFSLVGFVPGFSGKVTFVSNGENIKTILSDFINWIHDNGYSQSDITFDNYYIRFIDINYSNYQFVYNSNKLSTISYSIDKTEKDAFGNYKIEYSFNPIIFNYETKITNNIRLLNDDLNIDQILRVTAFRFNPYDLLDCDITISNLMKKRTIFGSSIRTPEEFKKEIRYELNTKQKEDEKEYGANDSNGFPGEDVGGSSTEQPSFDFSTEEIGNYLVVGNDRQVTTEKMLNQPIGKYVTIGEDGKFAPDPFTEDNNGQYLKVDPNGMIISEQVNDLRTLVVLDHEPKQSEVDPLQLGTIIFVYDATTTIDPVEG